MHYHTLSDHMRYIKRGRILFYDFARCELIREIKKVRIPTNWFKDMSYILIPLRVSCWVVEVFEPVPSRKPAIMLFSQLVNILLHVKRSSNGHVIIKWSKGHQKVTRPGHQKVLRSSKGLKVIKRSQGHQKVTRSSKGQKVIKRSQDHQKVIKGHVIIKKVLGHREVTRSSKGHKVIKKVTRLS